MTTLITIIRLLAILPLLFFFLEQSGRIAIDDEDTRIARVRRLTLVMCMGNMLLLAQITYTRLLYLTMNPASDLVSIIVSLIILTINFWSYLEFKNIQK